MKASDTREGFEITFIHGLLVHFYSVFENPGNHEVKKLYEEQTLTLGMGNVFYCLCCKLNMCVCVRQRE